MNLLDNLDRQKNNQITNPNIITFGDFRQIQYDQLEYFCNLCVDYISVQNNGYLVRDETTITNDVIYEDLFGYNTNRVRIRVLDSTAKSGKTTFLSFKIPALLNKSFFYINGSYYAPTCYILDKPISLKKKSIKLFGLFNSITIFTKDKRAIFTGDNIPINYFLALIQNKKLKSKFETKFGIKNTAQKDIVVNNYFSKLLQCEADRDKIIECIDRLFLDEYTKNLYKNCYGFKDDFNTCDIIEIALQMSLTDERPNFVDLTHKRMVFMELILQPIFKRCASVAVRASRGFKTTSLDSDSTEIIKHFTNKLKNKFLYESVNLYSGISVHKTSLMNPGSDNAPGSIASTHPTHYNRICPITISAQKPGETISVVPDLKLNKFGLFVDDDGEVLC